MQEETKGVSPSTQKSYIREDHIQKPEEEKIYEYIGLLERQNEFKSDLLSTSAHQMRTSLTASKWALEELLRGTYGTLSPEQRLILEKLSENTAQTVRSLSELINVNHTEESHPVYSFESIDINDLIEKTIADFHSEAVSKDIAVSFDDINVTTLILADKQKIKTVLQALIENAIKYSHRGGSVMVDTEAKEHELLITIRDEGIGIPEDEQSRMFEKFYRAKNAQAHQSIGSGLGLFSSLHIIQAHGGTLWFTSKEGVGTTFYISLPLAPSV